MICHHYDRTRTAQIAEEWLPGGVLAPIDRPPAGRRQTCQASYEPEQTSEAAGDRPIHVSSSLRAVSP